MQLTDVWAHHHTSAPHTPKRRREVRPSKGRAEADLVSSRCQLPPISLYHVGRGLPHLFSPRPDYIALPDHIHWAYQMTG